MDLVDMTYEKKHVCNIETGEIELVDLTPDEIAQRDAERASAEAEAELPPPKTEADELRALIADQARQIAELRELIRNSAQGGQGE
jgi:hypothetical protein